jgi:hypothetical protein
MQKEGSVALAHLPAPSRDVAHKPKRQAGASKRINMRQASNMMEAVAFAKLIGLPLVAHLTIHWAFTEIGDDPYRKLFTKFREGLDKWVRRHNREIGGAKIVGKRQFQKSS